MKSAIAAIRVSAVASVAGLAWSCATAPAEPVRLAGADCAAPPVLHCPDTGCPADVLAEGGDVLEPETGRTYFLDYPCDLMPGEDVTLVLSLHGAGATGNWHRHYFPLLDNVESHRLVVATPYAPSRIWSPDDDDGYLENIAGELIDEIGAANIGAFWLAGHSYGGMTSNRIACTEFFRDKVDGWLSLSGGRIGPIQVPSDFGPPGGGSPGDFPLIEGANGPERGGMGKAVTPACDISYIFETGEHEMTELPEGSPWAEKYECGPRVREDDVVDAAAGYVSGSARPGGENPAWGRAARPGSAEVYVYPNCRGGALVADVVRMDKGHTEGLEPRVTTFLIELMQSAPGGKLRDQAG